MAFFELAVQTCNSLHPHQDPTDYVSTYTGIIRYMRERDDRIFRIGKVLAYRIHTGLARQNGVSIFEVCDAFSQELLAIYSTLFDAGEDRLKEEIRDQFDSYDPDVLVLDYVLLHPRWRRLKLGLLAARKMIDLLEGGCGLVVADIQPCNPAADEFSGKCSQWIPRHHDAASLQAARKKLRRYFRRMGFERIRETGLFAMSLVRATPTSADLLRPRRRSN